MHNGEKILIISLIVLLLGFSIGGYVLSRNNQFNSNNDINENVNNNESDEVKDQINNKKNVITKNGNSYEIVLNENKVNLTNVVEFTDEELMSEENIFANVVINGFKLNGVDSSIGIYKIPSSASCVNIDNGKSKQLVINGILVDEMEYEGCYLLNYDTISIVKDKYVGVFVRGGSSSFDLYDEKSKKVYSRHELLDIDYDNYILKVMVFKDENFDTYTINEYQLVFENGKVTDKLIKTGTEVYEYTIGD